MKSILDKISVLYEDGDVLVINKPAGLVRARGWQKRRAGAYRLGGEQLSGKQRCWRTYNTLPMRGLSNAPALFIESTEKHRE